MPQQKNSKTAVSENDDSDQKIK